MIKEAWEYGDLATRLSFLVLGAGNIARKQIVKGLIYLAMEIGFFFYMFVYGITALSHFDDLGTVKQGQVYDETLGTYVKTAGHNSMLMLLAAVVALFVIALFVIVWRKSVLSGYRSQQLSEQGKHVNTFIDELQKLIDKK